MDNREEFMSLCESVHRDGMTALLEWLKSTDFFVAPASSKYHGNYPGGLLEHSLNVYHELQRLLKAFPEVQISEETAIISALFHDLCKVNFYVPEKRNRKNGYGQWETYDSYSIKEQFCYGGHGSKSVFIVQHFMKLTDEEAVAINCHMSCWDGNKDVGNAYSQHPFAWLLHVADEAATYIVESKEDK